MGFFIKTNQAKIYLSNHLLSQPRKFFDLGKKEERKTQQGFKRLAAK
jgi:hypothetical protein